MAIHVALLRAVNVAGANKLAMSDLRAVGVELGLINPRSLLQTGNLVFESHLQTTLDLEKLLEQETADRLNLRTDYFVRTVAELSHVIAAIRFPTKPLRTPATLWWCS